MVYVFIQHEVESYDEWKQAYDDHDETRVEHGQQGYQLFRDAENPNDVSIVVEVDTVENARAFLESDDLKERMAGAGVKGEPHVAFLEEIESRRSATPAA